MIIIIIIIIIIVVVVVVSSSSSSSLVVVVVVVVVSGGLALFVLTCIGLKILRLFFLDVVFTVKRRRLLLTNLSSNGHEVQHFIFRLM